MRTVTLKCSHCGVSFEKQVKEYDRQIREKGNSIRFFCTPKCAGIAINNAKKIDRTETKVCQCGKEFITETGATFCSRVCASLFSFTEERKKDLIRAGLSTGFKQGGESLPFCALGLRVREWNKYEKVYQILHSFSVEHLFEYHLEGTKFIYDLALFEIGVFVEFDERHHFAQLQSKIDHDKEQAAIQAGWQVYRLDVSGWEKPYSADIIYRDLIRPFYE